MPSIVPREAVTITGGVEYYAGAGDSGQTIEELLCLSLMSIDD